MDMHPHARPRRLWLSGIGFITLAFACGTATQPTTPQPVQLPSSSASTDSERASAPEPDCPDGAFREPGAGCVFEAEGAAPKGQGAAMRPIPAGLIGEGPDQRPVPSFWMDQRPVRVSEYGRCVQAGKCKPPMAGKDCPSGQDNAVACIPWKSAQTYCEWAQKRLITDDEWDRAVARHAAYGLVFDKVSEWTATLYCDERQGGCGHSRVLRNSDKPEGRHRMLPEYSWPGVGFRCVWSNRRPPVQKESPPQVPVVPTTPGAISCATATCDLGTDVCCENEQDGIGRCIPKQNAECPDLWVRAQCDENADCAINQVCCPYWGCSDGCPTERVCQAAPCDYGPEACLPGGLCRQGFMCVTEQDGRHGHCSWQDVGARCGGRRCSGDTPVCCWNVKSGTGTCGNEDCRGEDVIRLRCSSPRDCGGSTCGHNSFYGDPEQDVDPGYGCVPMSHLLNAVLCDSKKDCPIHPPTGAKPVACRHTRELPPGVKGCIYAEEP